MDVLFDVLFDVLLLTLCLCFSIFGIAGRSSFCLHCPSTTSFSTFKILDAEGLAKATAEGGLAGVGALAGGMGVGGMGGVSRVAEVVEGCWEIVTSRKLLAGGGSDVLRRLRRSRDA